MRILLTNDDGIHAEGLAVLERVGQGEAEHRCRAQACRRCPGQGGGPRGVRRDLTRRRAQRPRREADQVSRGSSPNSAR